MQSLYCSTWTGVHCNDQHQVTELDLSGLSTSVAFPVRLEDLLLDLRNLSQLQVLKLQGNPQLFKGSSLPDDGWELWLQLQHLDLSNCGLAGRLPSGLGDGLAKLSHLNLSGNSGITGMLPESLVSVPLAVLDVSGTSLQGQLPAIYAALPLQVLRRSWLACQLVCRLTWQHQAVVSQRRQH